MTTAMIEATSSGSSNLLWWMPALPLLGAALCGILHFQTLAARRRDPNANGPSLLAAPIACLAMLGAFAIAVSGFGTLSGLEESARALVTTPWHWIDTGDFMIDVALVLDPLSAVMCLVITGVGSLIHIYASGYMKGDPGYAKFFAYLNLFVAAMLILVLSSSLLGLFVGWEGVGLCSYLLIGFWYDKGWPAEAGQKAFVMNRVGDALFLLGSFLLVSVFASLDLSTIAHGVGPLLAEDPSKVGTLALAALCLFGGACGKSAQFPLFTWLPDAMAGPTPVSALIHAATMVTAGVYLVARLSPVFAAEPGVLVAIGTVGAFTALLGATTALQQRDLKKVLAYSTVSQLGYMFLALGAGAWAAAVFHLVTHAFFKGLLFLGAGSVIHGMHEEQDMGRMGGLRKHMPTTYWTFLIGAAALAGLPGLSGFFSKDEILALNFGRGGFHWMLWIVGVVTAGLTAFYSWRMVALTFHGKERFDPDKVHPHESPRSMTVPLMVLAVLAAGGGLLNLPHVLGGISQKLHHWLEPVTHEADALLGAHWHEVHLSAMAEWILLGLGAAIALACAHKGFHAYTAGTGADERFEEKRPQAASFLRRAWGIDEGYTNGIVAPIQLVSFGIAAFIDRVILDGAVVGCGAVARRAGAGVRKLSDGNLKTYALWMSAGAATLALAWIWS